MCIRDRKWEEQQKLRSSSDREIKTALKTGTTKRFSSPCIDFYFSTCKRDNCPFRHTKDIERSVVEKAKQRRDAAIAARRKEKLAKKSSGSSSDAERRRREQVNAVRQGFDRLTLDEQEAMSALLKNAIERAKKADKSVDPSSSD